MTKMQHHSLIYMKKFWFRLVVVACVYLAIEGLSWFGLLVLEKTRNITYRPVDFNALSEKDHAAVKSLIAHPEKKRHSPGLGWIEPESIRGRTLDSLKPKDEVMRIATFGDSFTYGAEVKAHETWQEQLNGMEPNLDVLNLGVGGYGFDQALLRYLKDGVSLESDVVMIGFLTENMLRNLNTFRPFYLYESQMPFAKPRFVFAEEELRLVANPLPTLDHYQQLLDGDHRTFSEIMKHDYFIRHYHGRGPLDFLPSVRFFKTVSQNLRVKFSPDRTFIEHMAVVNEDSEAFELATSLFDAFNAQVTNRNSIPIVLLFPARIDFVLVQEGKETSYEPFARYLKGKGYRFIDLMDAFRRHGVGKTEQELFRPGDHYAPLAHQTVAKHVLEALQANGIVKTKQRGEEK